MKKLMLLVLLSATFSGMAQNSKKQMSPAPAQAPAAPKKNVPVSKENAPPPPPADVKARPSGPANPAPPAPAAAPADVSGPAPKATRPATRGGSAKAVKYKNAKVKKEKAEPKAAQK